MRAGAKAAAIVALLGATLCEGAMHAQPAEPAEPAAPATAGALPPGHPPVDEGDEEEATPPPSTANPHGRSGAATGALFDPPPDTAEDDPSLPVGTMVVTIEDAQGRPIPHAPLAIGVVHSTVAKGESSEHLNRDADDAGAARLDGLLFGSATTYHLSTTRGPATYTAPPFALGDKVGKRAVLHAYEVSTTLEGLMIGTQGAVYLALRENAIQVEQLFSVFNMGPVSWQADTTIALPKGFKAFNKQDSTDDLHVDEVPGTGVALRGTAAPGRHDLTFRYQIPLDDNERQSLQIALPPRTASTRVMAESSKTMGLEVAGFPQAQRITGRDGKKLLITEHQVARAEGGMTTVDITLSGLPTPGSGRWVAVFLAVITLLGGFVYAYQKRDPDALDDDEREDLREARDALLDELVTLERAHKDGEVGPKTYARVRASLLDALARIVAMLDRARDARTEARRRRSGDGGGSRPQTPGSTNPRRPAASAT